KVACTFVSFRTNLCRVSRSKHVWAKARASRNITSRWSRKDPCSSRSAALPRTLPERLLPVWPIRCRSAAVLSCDGMHWRKNIVDFRLGNPGLEIENRKSRNDDSGSSRYEDRGAALRARPPAKARVRSAHPGGHREV